ncbi:magnesium transporter [Rhodobacter viridis]|uniref:Magnesium transporter n=1 Tax=Rhodobacter viridis TaxID=1054202 RepID=A0A318TTJ5_9RHOB|nr:CorA family divalent cation transporter [Rhodobacter viridis]PYF08166.1 magnesium transporter [Rhodobacter viridis]
MFVDTIRDLLRKQRLVEDLVRSNQSSNQEVVETILQRQHLVEIERTLAGLSVAQIAGLLQDLPLEEASQVWQRISEERQNEILWELDADLRERLAGLHEPRFSANHVHAFELKDGRLRQISVTRKSDLKDVTPFWIDMLNASAAERAYVGELFGLALPDPGDTTDLEVTSRFHIEEGGELHLHSNFLLDREGNSRSVPVAFIVHRGILFSLRNEELPVFRLHRRQIGTMADTTKDCFDLLLSLYGADVQYSADSLEDIYKTLSRAGKHVLSEKMSDAEAAAVLADIAEEEDLNGRIRSNILDTQRALAFLIQIKALSGEQFVDCKQILRNIDSLNSHTAFLFDKINFLMDATIGFININQNRRVQQLTMFSVVIMPINVLAGIGGMSEFSMMTQSIPWPIAYLGFLLGSGLVGWTTYVLVRRSENRRRSTTAKR